MLRASLFVLIGLVLLRSQLWRAVLCLRPSSVRIDEEEPSATPAVPSLLEQPWSALSDLGFRWLGTHSERPVWGPATLHYDAVHPEALAFASLSLHRDQARLLVLTATESGFVLTCDYRRAAREQPGRYLAGALEGVSPQRLFKAHQRRVAELGVVRGTASLEGRVELAREWYRGPGNADLRGEHAMGLLWALGGLLLVIAGSYGACGE
jgi:hypothetical protein